MSETADDPTTGTHDHAFDATRPPSRELIDACVHCGFCLPTCPTYVLWGEEMDSPRGRIVLMKEGLEAGSDLAEMAVHFDRCLGCMACVTACPSGVEYDRLIEATRPQVERNLERSPAERAFRRLMFALFTHPGRLRAATPFLAAGRALGLTGLVGRLQRFPRMRTLARLTPPVPARAAFARLPELTRAQGSRRGRVGLLQGCVQRVFFHDVNTATARVLSAEGFDVFAPRLPRCCGALMLHTGYEPEARDLARATISAFEDCELVAVNAAGCGSAMKEYVNLLADDPEWASRARAFCEKVRDISELLVEVGPAAQRRPVPISLAYHDACHLAHAQGVRAQPRELLRAVPGVELMEPVEWEICCGSAGVYNLLEADAGEQLGQRKAQNLLATGAEAVAAGNPGCALQISTYLQAVDRPLPVYHPVQVLDASINGSRL
ncbi:MAG: 4Fe-4S dicluster domain-containing protein [Nitriliruptorales bacterium]|nr:4Fe-4S dicluster domain-containing protein [Nitriliruptorales bacterium]